MSDTDDGAEEAIGMFDEPSDYYKPEAEPGFATHTLRCGDILKLRLVGSNPLWVGKRDPRLWSEHAEKYRVIYSGTRDAP